MLYKNLLFLSGRELGRLRLFTVTRAQATCHHPVPLCTGPVAVQPTSAPPKGHQELREHFLDGNV